MLVEPRSATPCSSRTRRSPSQNLERAIQTEIQVLEGQQVRERVQQDLGLDDAAAGGRRHVRSARPTSCR